MAFKLYGYWNTGFDLINVPDSPALLESSAASVSELPTIDVVDVYFMSQIKIKTINKNLRNLDYLKVVKEASVGMPSEVAYYNVINWVHTSEDVAILNVVQDTILTCGGAKQILGNCSINAVRAHVAPSDDTFGAYCEDDEYITPREPLQLAYGGSNNSGGSGLDSFAATHKDGSNVGSAICVPRVGMFFAFDMSSHLQPSETIVISDVGLAHADNATAYLPADLSQGITYYGNYTVGTGTGTVQCTDRFTSVPEARGLTVKFPDLFFNKSNLGPYVSVLGNTDIEYEGLEGNYLYSNNSGSSPRTAIQALVSLGYETSVLYSYNLPAGAGYLSRTSATNLPTQLRGNSYIATTNSGNAYSSAKCSAYDYDYLGDRRRDTGYGAFHNNRILYGKFRSYIIGSPATGNTMEAKPEELTAGGFRIASSSDVGKNGAPSLFCFTDPRPTGRPYFNFIKYGTNKLNDVLNLAEGAIAGGQWPEVPIVFTGKSGSYLATLGYNMSAAYKDWMASTPVQLANAMSGAAVARDVSIANAWDNATTASVGSMVGGAIAGGVKTGNVLGAVGGIVTGAGTAMYGGYVAEQNAQNNYMNVQLANSASANAANAALASGNLLVEATNGNTYANVLYQRQQAAALEKMQFELSNSYEAPRVNFLSSDSMRDITRNCLFYARYTPTETDLNRMDRILDAYGYKMNEIVKGVTRRQYFDYIQGSVVSADWRLVSEVVGSRKDLLADIMSQLANGLRIWHVNPSGRAIEPGGAYS